VLLEEESVCLRDYCLTLGIRDSTSMLHRIVWVLLCFGNDGFTYTLEMLTSGSTLKSRKTNN